MRPSAGPPPTDIGVQVGLVVAAAKVPETFAPGLATRSAVDQGFVTALSTGVHYLLAVGTQEALRAAAAELARTPAAARWGDPASRQRTLGLALDVAVIPVGLTLRRLLPSHPGEAMARGWVRQAGWRATTTGIAAVSLEAARVGLRVLDDRLGAGGRVAGLPIAVPLGLTIAVVVDRQRGLPGDDDAAERSARPPFARSVLVAAGVEGGLATAAYAEHALAGVAGRRLADLLPGGPHLWRLVAHGACLGLLAVGASADFAHEVVIRLVQEHKRVTRRLDHTPDGVLRDRLSCRIVRVVDVDQSRVAR